MEPILEVADNFLYPASRRRAVWYIWAGLALGLTTVAAGLWWFMSLVQPLPEPKAVYLNPSLKVRLQYPAAWLPTSSPLDTDGLPRRFVGQSGWFELGATTGEGVLLTDVAASLSQAGTLPFGANPEVRTVEVQGQPAAFILPREPALTQAAAVVTYPEPVSNGFSLYRFVVVKADVKHLPALVASLRFIANGTGEVSDLRNVLVYAPPAQAVATSPFIVSGIARVFENTVSLKVVNEDEETVWTGFTTANAPDVGTYGGYSAIVDLSGTELTAGDRVRLEVFQSSAKDGSEIDKVVVPLELKEVQATQVVEAYFGSGPGGSADDCTTVLAVERHVPKTLAVARAALDELMKGPTLREREEGYFTSLPPGVVVQRLVIAEGVAQADFTPALEQGVGGSCRVLAIRAQIEKTLRQFPSVQSVVISIDGRTEDILQP